MDRSIIYTGSQPRSIDILFAQRAAMTAIGKVYEALVGTTTTVSGLACTQTASPSLAVLVGEGQIISLQNLDSNAYSSLAADTAHQIMKQGLLMDAVTLACPAPVTAGQSINYLIEATFQETDSGSTVLPYYNSANPTVPYSGPGNTGSANLTTRLDQCVVAVKAGTPAATGSQTTPAADTGYVGLYVVMVAYGQTSVLNANISLAAAAPFITPISSAPTGHGQCRLSLVSSSQLILKPFNGRSIIINGASYAIPQAGITLANTGLAAATLYYVYLFNNSGTLTLEASTTTHATDTSTTNYGVEIKSGDASRTLVGMVYMGAGTPGTFIDSATQRYLANWFNRRSLVLGGNGVTASTSSASMVVLGASANVSLVTWADEPWVSIIGGLAANSTGSFGASLSLGVDGTSSQGVGSTIISPSANQQYTVTSFSAAQYTEGYHLLAPYGLAYGGGTATFSVAQEVYFRG